MASDPTTLDFTLPPAVEASSGFDHDVPPARTTVIIIIIIIIAVRFQPLYLRTIIGTYSLSGMVPLSSSSAKPNRQIHVLRQHNTFANLTSDLF